jgi:hypothetical protein
MQTLERCGDLGFGCFVSVGAALGMYAMISRSMGASG